MKKAATKAATARVARKTAASARLDVATAVAPDVLKIAIKRTNTAYAAGFLTCAQSIKHMLTHKFRSFGEAIDGLHSMESAMLAELQQHIAAELASRRIKQDGRNVMTEAAPEGPFIVLKKPEIPPEAQQALANLKAKAPTRKAAVKKAPAKAAKKAAAPSAAPATAVDAVPAKRKYTRRAK